MTWTCESTRRSLLEQEEPSLEALDHWAECPICQEMVALETPPVERGAPNSSAQTAELDRLFEGTEHRVAVEQGALAWLRSLPTRQRLLLGLGAAGIPALLQLLLARRADLAHYPTARLLLESACLIGLIALSANALLKPVHLPDRARTRRASLVLAFLAPVLLAASASIEADLSSVYRHIAELSLPQAAKCLRYGSLLSAPVLCLVFALDRRGGHSRDFPALLAGFGGLVGNLLLLYHCSSREPLHLLLGHATIGLLQLIVLGLLLRRRRP